MRLAEPAEAKSAPLAPDEPNNRQNSERLAPAVRKNAAKWWRAEIGSDAENAVQHSAVPRLRGREHLDDAPLFDEGGRVGDAQRHVVILFGEQDRHARRLERC